MGGNSLKIRGVEKFLRIALVSMEWHPKYFGSADFEDSKQKSAINPYP